MPLDSNGDFAGDVADLFSAYTVVAGIAVVLLFAFHGAAFLTLRTTGDLRERAAAAARRLAASGRGGRARGFLVWTVVVAVDRNDKDVFPARAPGGRSASVRARRSPCSCVRAGRSGWAFVADRARGDRCVVATLFTSLYPRVMVSSPTSRTASRSRARRRRTTRSTVMTVVALILTPVVLLYQGWTYYVFRARLGGRGARHRPDDAAVAQARPTVQPGGGRCARSTRASLRRARAVRVLLGVDVALGVVAALLVLAQAVLLARVVGARVRRRRRSPTSRPPLVLLVASSSARAAAAWGFEVAGRRAATDVLSQLRLDARRAAAARRAGRARRRRERRGRDGRRRRASTRSRRLRALPAAGRAGRRRAGRGARARRRDRPRLRAASCC